MGKTKVNWSGGKNRSPNKGSYVKTVDPYDIVGKKFDKLLVVKLHSKQIRHYYYECLCDCGNTIIKRRSSILHPEGKHVSCGCHVFEEATKDIIGNTYNMLTVISFDHTTNNSSGKHNFYFKCKCECGNICIVEKRSLMNGHVKSCGCLKNTKNGLSTTKFGRVHASIIDRCYNPNAKYYRNYGGRGIKVCDRWLDEKDGFNNFYNDMHDSYLEHVEKYGEDNTSIDRKDVNGNYDPNNCRWATNEIQANNKTTNHMVYYNGEELTLKEAVDKYALSSIDYHTVKHRLYAGWSINAALNTPTPKITKDGHKAKCPIIFK